MISDHVLTIMRTKLNICSWIVQVAILFEAFLRCVKSNS